MSFLSRSKVRSSLKKALIPFVIKDLLSSDIVLFNSMKMYSFGSPSVKLYYSISVS